MNQFSVPKLLGDMMSVLPAYPGSVLFVSALNMILTPRLPEDVRVMILGKQLRLSITDARLDFNFVWTKGGFVAGWRNVEPDMIISASAYDFYQLSRPGKKDPDTLFFSRRLVMAGDTELGLVLKNTIDAMDLNVFELVKSVPVRKFLELIPGYKKP